MDTRHSQYSVARADGELGRRSEQRSGDCNTYLGYVDMPTGTALRGLTEVGRNLLATTAELPDTEQGLLEVLVAYRYAVYAFVNVVAKLS